MKFLIALFPFLLCLLSVSCKEETREQKLIGKWQEVTLIDPQLDESVQNQRVFTDTVGTSTDSAQNRALYGTDNIDTMKAMLKKNLDSFRKAQYFAVQATWFDFRKDGIMYVHSNEGLDSGNWYLDEAGALIIDKTKLKGSGGKKRLEILALNDTALRLQSTKNYLNRISVFKPMKN